MYCSQCGSKNDEGAGFCTQCGAALKVAGAAPQQPAASQVIQQPAPQYVQSVPAYPTSTTTVIYQAAPAAPAAPAGGSGYPPSSHLFLGIVSTFCCGCFPVGLISLIFAIMTMSRVGGGQIEKARGSSRQAAIWGWIAVLLGLLMYIGWAIWVFLMGGLAALQQVQQR